jgi:hypothetical protein
MLNKTQIIKDLNKHYENKKAVIELIDIRSEERKQCNSFSKFKNILSSSKVINEFKMKENIHILDYVNSENKSILAFISLN